MHKIINPINLIIRHQAPLAQLVERGTSNAEVTGSTPLGGINVLSVMLEMHIILLLDESKL